MAGFVGADHVSMVLSTDVWQAENTVIALDLGTNTEIMLVVDGRMLSCSCESGPAFEGAHIRDGMRAAPGAIERVQIVDGEVRTYTIGDEPPVGICGSGILDVVSEMRVTGILDEKGAQSRARSRSNRLPLPLSRPGGLGHRWRDRVRDRPTSQGGPQLLP